MAQEKTVTKMAIRAAYEAVCEIMGENARDMIFRDAGLTRVLGSPPDYTWDKEATVEEQANIYLETLKLVGDVGGQGILRLIGYKSTQTPVVRFGVADHIKDLPQGERITKAFELLQLAANKGRIVAQPGGLPGVGRPRLPPVRRRNQQEVLLLPLRRVLSNSLPTGYTARASTWCGRQSAKRSGTIPACLR